QPETPRRTYQDNLPRRLFPLRNIEADVELKILTNHYRHFVNVYLPDIYLIFNLLHVFLRHHLSHRFTPPTTSRHLPELHSLISNVRVHPVVVFEGNNFVSTQREPDLISRFTLFTDRRNRAVHSWFIRHFEPPVQIVWLLSFWCFWQPV